MYTRETANPSTHILSSDYIYNRRLLEYLILSNIHLKAQTCPWTVQHSLMRSKISFKWSNISIQAVQHLLKRYSIHVKGTRPLKLSKMSLNGRTSKATKPFIKCSNGHSRERCNISCIVHILKFNDHYVKHKKTSDLFQYLEIFTLSKILNCSYIKRQI